MHWVDVDFSFCLWSFIFFLTWFYIWQQKDNEYDDEDLYKSHIVNVLQDIMEIITKDVMSDGYE